MSLQWDNNFIDVTHKLEQYVKTTNILFKKQRFIFTNYQYTA